MTQTLYASTAKPVLLQTATAWTCNPSDLRRNKKLHIVMDGGSQRSYITTSGREALRLPMTDRKRLAVAAFGSKRMEPRLCYVVRVKVCAKAGETTRVDLFVLPHICEPITYQPLAECVKLFPHLANLELADDQIGDSRGRGAGTGPVGPAQAGPIFAFVAILKLLSGWSFFVEMIQLLSTLFQSLSQ